MARPVTPPEPPVGSRPAAVVRLPGAIDRADVPAVVELGRQAAAVAREASVIRCEAGAVASPGMPVVEVLARLALDARRHHRELRLVGASPALLDLIDLCGLRRFLGEPIAGDDPPRRSTRA